MVVAAAFIRSFRALAHQLAIVDISSGAAFLPFASWSSYCVSKAARVMFHGVLAQELQLQSQNAPESSLEAKTLCYCPGVMATDILKEVAEAVDSPVKKELCMLVETVRDSRLFLLTFLSDRLI